MFDIAFSELMVIGTVALVVIGPEKLPKVARNVGKVFGQTKRLINTISADIDRELQLDELQRLDEEIRQNMLLGGKPYQVGEVIDHSKIRPKIKTEENTAQTSPISDA